eukprot:s55_g21.t1
MVQSIYGSSWEDPLFTGVVEIHGHTGDVSVGHRIPCSTPTILCQAEVPYGRHSLYDFDQSYEGGILLLKSTPTSWQCQAPGKPDGLSPNIIELCAGVGGMGLGAEYLGGRACASVDWSSISVDHLRVNTKGHVFQLDITDLTSIRTVHQQCPLVGTTTLGFPCQPHSLQGNRRGSADPRSQVFRAGLRFIFMTQSQTAIMECVPMAGQNPDILSDLKELAEVMQWHVLTTLLDLGDRWASRRSRWWALLLPAAWHVYDLSSWTFSDKYATVGSLLSSWGVWPISDEQALELNDIELQAYGNPRLGADKRLLELTDKANTMLHSYGNVFQSCPCLCRSSAFRMATLETSGLRGFYIRSLVTGQMRYLHPKEAALLLGLPDHIQHLPDVKAALALLGLVASPIQMVWVYSHLLQNVNAAKGGAPIPSPDQWLDQYCDQLVNAVRFDPARQSHPLQVLDPVHGLWTFSCTPASTILDFLRANRIFIEWNEAGGVSVDGQRLSLEDRLVHCRTPLQLDLSPGPHDRALPHERLVIMIRHQGDTHVHLMQQGQFLFEALRALHIDFVNFLMDSQGRVIAADYRVWQSLNLTTSALDLWPPALPGFTAHGLFPCGFGLSSHQVWAVMQAMQCHIHDLHRHWIHPHIAHALLQASDFPRPSGRLIPLCRSCACIFEASGHWALLWGEQHSQSWQWTYYDGLSACLCVPAHHLATGLSALLGLSTWTFRVEKGLVQLSPNTCGTVALLQLCHLLGLSALCSAQSVDGLHQFLLGLLPSGLPGLPCLFGLGPTSVDGQLAAVLATKGVPFQHAAERATAAVKKLGHQAVLQALQSNNPWRDLKALTTKPGNSFQFVTKAELQAFIDQRAATQHGAQISTRKKKDRKSTTSVAAPSLPDPQHLQILPGHFVDADNDQVGQVPLSQVVTDARGIAICTKAEALPFIQEYKSISADALALLITEDIPTDLRGAARISSLRYPVTYLPTADPLLVQGCLLQLGDVPVSRHDVKAPLDDMEVTTTTVLKVQMYRDELSTDWALVASSPIKQLIILVPKFRRCTPLHCDHKCGLYHLSVEEDFDQVIHEIWGRRFQSLDGKQLPADQAALFQAYLRVAAPALTELLSSIVEGVYLEPRAEATRCMYTAYEEAAHAELRPGDDFIKVTVSKVYRIHPLPHGLQRAQVAKLLREWRWNAKPLQPSRGSSDGGAWDIGTAVEPPAAVLPAFNRDVLVTLLKDRQEPDRAPAFVGSRRVQAHLRAAGSGPSASASTSSADPWQMAANDPWKTFMANKSSAPSSQPPKRIEELATKLRADLSAHVNEQLGSQSHPSANDARLHQLEVGMTELQAHNKQFHSWFAEAGKRMSAQDEQLQTLQGQLSQQQSDLVAVRSEVHSSAENLHQAMQVSFHAMKTDLTTDISTALSAQMDRLETMISSKKTRHE